MNSCLQFGGLQLTCVEAKQSIFCICGDLEIREFISNITLVASFLKDQFISNDYIDIVVTDLDLRQDLYKFIRIITIRDEINYKKKLKLFESNLKVFFTVGGKSFWTKEEVIGDN